MKLERELAHELDDHGSVIFIHLKEGGKSPVGLVTVKCSATIVFEPSWI